MIVRIATEGQYEVGEDEAPEFNRLDNEAVAACEDSDAERFREVFDRLLQIVRTKGRRVSEDTLLPSDVILPPPDVSLEEARKEFQGEGLIPG